MPSARNKTPHGHSHTLVQVNSGVYVTGQQTIATPASAFIEITFGVRLFLS